MYRITRSGITLDDSNVEYFVNNDSLVTLRDSAEMREKVLDLVGKPSIVVAVGKVIEGMFYLPDINIVQELYPFVGGGYHSRI
jgi:hypothetical protein